MKRAAPMFLAAMLACAILADTALAAETPGNARPAALYPVEVTEQTDGDYHRLEKVYILSGADDPAHIPTADFEREGWHYTLLDLTRQEQTDTETKYHTEIVTFDSASKDMDKILPQLAATTEITTEDGYTGVLTLDTASIKVEAAGYGTSSRTVTATRSYPNLSDADASLIPKTTQESGRTLTLADVQWQEAGDYYNAVASYTGTATSKYATGYVVTASYTGEVALLEHTIVAYTAVFSGTPIGGISPSPEEPGQTEPPQPVQPGTDGGNSFELKWLLVLPAAAGAVGLVFGGKHFYKMFKSKKEWRDYTK